MLMDAVKLRRLSVTQSVLSCWLCVCVFVYACVHVFFSDWLHWDRYYSNLQWVNAVWSWNKWMRTETDARDDNQCSCSVYLCVCVCVWACEHLSVYLALIRSLKETRPANLSRSLPSARVLELILHSTLMSVFTEAFRNLTATSGWV